MRDLLLLAVQLIVTLAKFMRPGGVRSVIAESLLVKHQLIISGRSRRRAPPLTTIDRFVLGLMVPFVRPRRIARLAAILKPATLLRFHKALVDHKYRHLFSSARTGTRCKPGPKGPAEQIISAIIEMKLRNPRFGNQRIAEQISHVFAVQIDKDVVRRVLATHYGPDHPGASGPSWLTFFAQAKDSLWSVDLLRCESILLRSHWVLVVIDVFTRRIIGFGIGGEYIDGPHLCRMFLIRPLPVKRRRRG
jgi:transposase InsO family protein